MRSDLLSAFMQKQITLQVLNKSPFLVQTKTLFWYCQILVKCISTHTWVHNNFLYYPTVQIMREMRKDVEKPVEVPVYISKQRDHYIAQVLHRSSEFVQRVLLPSLSQVVEFGGVP